jgi:streptomycin 3"-adenylyltransferase
LPDACRPVLSAARSVYLNGDGADEPPSCEPVAPFVRYARIIEAMLST